MKNATIWVKLVFCVYFFPLKKVRDQILMKEKEFFKYFVFIYVVFLLHFLAVNAKQFEIKNLESRVLKIVHILNHPKLHGNFLYDSLVLLEMKILLGRDEIYQNSQGFDSIAFEGIVEAKMQKSIIFVESQKDQANLLVSCFKLFVFDKLIQLF